ncbi:hypothetical protein ZIOFF_030768 [Zingiber officinale]|uniref:Uncharacterized protein n=1 Tax=Zingiber officinale TaxID=94328 RepID=A0A8J5GRF7_ZINOF|nr:hypothetical protein ZIOFF_030768 [Zingiber officinale]
MGDLDDNATDKETQLLRVSGNLQIADGSFPLVTFIEGYKFGFVLFIPVFAGSEIGKTIGSTKLNADLYLRRVMCPY